MSPSCNFPLGPARFSVVSCKPQQPFKAFRAFFALRGVHGAEKLKILKNHQNRKSFRGFIPPELKGFNSLDLLGENTSISLVRVKFFKMSTFQQQFLKL